MIVMIAIFILLPLISSSVSFQHVMIMFMMYAAAGEAWNILTGFSGQTSFGHTVFFGIGAYTSSMMLYRYGISPWIGMLVGGVFASMLAFIVSYPCFRLRGHYFAVATLCVAEIAQRIFLNWRYVEGATGITIPILDSSLKNMMFHESKIPYYYIIMCLFFMVMIIAHLIENSKLGFYLKAIRESHDAAEAIGINPTNTKMKAMLISSFLTALCGSFYAQYILYIDPFMVFSLNISMKVVLITTLGGVGHVFGPLIGAAILIPLSEYSRFILGGTGKGIDLIVFGLLVVVVSCYQPYGIMGIFRNMGKKRGGKQVEQVDVAS